MSSDVGPLTTRPARGAVLALLVAALALRLYWAAIVARSSDTPRRWQQPDSQGYLQLAETWRAAGRFDRPGPPPGRPELIRTPGYPALLALCGAIGQVVPVTLAAQMLISTATVGLVIGLAARSGTGPAAALGAGCLAAVEPLSLVYACQILSETLATALLVASILGWSAWHDATTSSARHRTGVLAVAGLLLAVFVRPAFYGLVPLLGLWLLAAGPRGPGVSRWRWPLILAICALVSLGGWQLRNFLRGNFPGFSGISPVNQYFYLAAAVEARATGRPYLDVRRQWGYDEGETRWAAQYAPDQPPSRAGDPLGPALKAIGRRARQVIADYPGLACQIQGAGCLRMLLDPGGSELLRPTPLAADSAGWLATSVDQGPWATARQMAQEQPRLLALQIVLGLPLATTYLLALVGAAVIFRRRPALVLLWGLWIGYLVLVSGGPAATARFRHPIMPLCAALAGPGLWWLDQRWRARRAGAIAAGKQATGEAVAHEAGGAAP